MDANLKPSAAPVRPQDRFTGRADMYGQYRPAYPAKIIDVLRRRAGLTRDSIVVDVGSGAGHSASLFLSNGNVVFAVEPNADMRAQAEQRLAPLPRFHSIEGSAEATTLPDACADFVVAATAFHWFDADAARREFSRILKPDGHAVLIWQIRRDDVGFSAALERLIRAHCPDYTARVEGAIKGHEAMLARFYGRLGWRHATLANEQRFQWPSLRGRVLSMSFMPREADAAWANVEHQLREIYEQFTANGEVTVDYRILLYFGALER